MKIITLQISADEAGIIHKSLELMSDCIPEAMKGADPQTVLALTSATEFLKLKVSAAIEQSKGA